MDELINTAVTSVLADANEHFYKIIFDGNAAQEKKVKIKAPTLQSLEKLVKYVLNANGSPRSRRWAVVVLLWLLRHFPRVKEHLRGLKLLRSNIGAIVFDENEDLRTVCAALVAVLWSSSRDLQSIWPKKLFKNIDLGAFPINTGSNSWLESLQMFVARCSPMTNGVIPTCDSSFQAVAIGIGEQHSENHLRFLCIIADRWLIIMSAKPDAEDIFVLEAPFNKIDEVSEFHRTLVDSSTGSQEEVPVLAIKLAQDSSITFNCTFNTKQTSLQSLDLYVRNNRSLREAHRKLQNAIKQATGPLMDIGERGFPSQASIMTDDSEEEPLIDANALVGVRSPATQAEPVSLAQPSNRKELLEDARQDPNPVDVNAHGKISPSKTTMSNTLKVLVQDSLNKEDVVDEARGHAGDQSRTVDVATSSAVKRERGRPPKKQAAINTVLRNHVMSPSTKKLRPRVEATPAVVTTRNLRSRKDLVARTSKKDDSIGKTTLSSKQGHMVKKPDESIWDVPSSGGTDRDAPKSRLQAKSRRRRVVEDADEDDNQSGSDRDLLANLPVGFGTQKPLSTAKSPETGPNPTQKSSAQPTKKTKDKSVVQPASSRARKKAPKATLPMAARKHDKKTVNGSVGHKSAAPKVDTRSLDDFEDAVIDFDGDKPTAISHGKSIIVVQTPLKVSKSSVKSAGLRQAVPSSTKRQHGTKQDDLVDETVVKKKAFISFGPQGPKNQASRAFGQMLDDNDDELGSGGVRGLGAYFQSSTQKPKSSTSRTALDVTSSIVKVNAGAKLDQQISLSATKKRSKVASSAQQPAKRQKLAVRKAQEPLFKPLERLEMELEASEHHKQSRNSQPHKLKRLVTTEGSVVAPEEDIPPSVHGFSPPRFKSMRQPNFHVKEIARTKDEIIPAKKPKGRLWSLLAENQNQTEHEAAAEQGHVPKRQRLPLQELASSPPQYSAPRTQVRLNTQSYRTEFKGFDDINYSQSRPQSQRQASQALSQGAVAAVVDLTQSEEEVSDDEEMADHDPAPSKTQVLAEAEGQSHVGMDDILAAQQLHTEQRQYSSSVEPAPAKELRMVMQAHAVTPHSTRHVRVPQTPLVDYPPSDEEITDDEQPPEIDQGAEWDMNLQPRHQTLLANLYGLARRLIAQVVETEDKMTAEVDTYFNNGHSILNERGTKIGAGSQVASARSKKMSASARAIKQS